MAGESALAEHAGERAAADLPAGDLAAYDLWRRVATGQPAGAAPSETAPALVVALEALLRVEELDAVAAVLSAIEHTTLDARDRHELLAGVYLRRGFLKSAADEWIAACDERGPDAHALVGLAHVAWARGMHEDAVLFAREGEADGRPAIGSRPAWPSASRPRTASTPRFCPWPSMTGGYASGAQSGRRTVREGHELRSERNPAVTRAPRAARAARHAGRPRRRLRRRARPRKARRSLRAEPASPPFELREEVLAAQRAMADMLGRGRELHFEMTDGRLRIELRDLDGDVLKEIPPTDALAVASGRIRD